MLHRSICIAAAVTALTSAAWGAGTLVVADFERDTSGFAGLERDSGRPHDGAASGRISVDFTHGDSRWVHVGKRLGRLDRDFTEVSFWVMSDEINSVTFRVVDSTGQTHQQRPRFEPDGRWHRLAISKFDGGHGYQSWGGAKDNTWHAPAKEMAFIVEKGNVAGGKGALNIDTVVAKLSEERILPEFGLGEGAPLANVFLVGERVSLPVETKGDSVEWGVTDVWQEPVAWGTAAPVDGLATIAPALGGRIGYFLVKLDISKGGEPIAERYTSFAVVPPYTVRDRESSPFGVMTHFAQGWDIDIMPLIAKAGIVSVRDEHYWNQVEQKKGVYSFPAKSARYMAECRKYRIDPLVAMTFANKLHDGGLTPHTPEGCDAYGRYGQAILKEYGSQVKWLEIWNEYNGSWCEGPCAKDRPKYYTQMLKHAYRHIKKVRPDVKVLGCATVLIPMPYLEGIFKHGGLKYMDAVVIHPYRGRAEGVDEEVAELEATIRKYNDGVDKPIWVTETGKWCHDEYEWEKGKGLYEMGRAEVARYLIRQQTLLLTRNVEKIHWYLLRDYAEFRTMGLLRNIDDRMGMYAVAPAYVSYCTLIRQLEGAKFVEREAMRPYTRARVYRFQRDGKDVRICWATSPSEIRFETSSHLRVVDMMGEQTYLRTSGSEARLKLGEAPVFVLGRADEVVEIQTGPRVLADSGDDYSKTQGKNNWRYGYYAAKGAGGGNGRPPSGPHTDDDFVEMKHQETVWGYTWQGPMQYLSMGRDGGHPLVDGTRQIWAVRRWTSPYAGKVTIQCELSRSDQGRDGCEGVLLIDGRRLVKKGIGGKMFPKKETFEVTVDVVEGTLVDFAITPGPQSELMYDSAGFAARIVTAE